MSDDPIVLPEVAPVVDLARWAIKHGDWCQHRSVYVCNENREVTCKICKAVLDPFEELLKVAQRHGRILQETTAKRAEIAELQKVIDELKRDEHNTRARLARLDAKEAPTRIAVLETFRQKKGPFDDGGA